MTTTGSPARNEALERARWSVRHWGVHLSKTTIRTFRACPQAYGWEKVGRLPGADAATLAQLRGITVHAALARAIKQLTL